MGELTLLTSSEIVDDVNQLAADAAFGSRAQGANYLQLRQAAAKIHDNESGQESWDQFAGMVSNEVSGSIKEDIPTCGLVIEADRAGDMMLASRAISDGGNQGVARILRPKFGKRSDTPQPPDPNPEYPGAA